MELIEKKENKIVIMEKIDESLANAIRRYVNEILTPAIDEVEIFKNDSAMYDETLAHRIGLIPLKFEKSFDEKKNTELKLSVKNEGIVYSEELKGSLEVVYPKMPLVILNKGQELELLAKIKLGRGSEHSKFSPGTIFYRNLAEIKIDKNCDLCSKCVEVCPKKVLKMQDKKIIIENLNCDMCGACIEACKTHGKNSIQINPTEEVVITIESFGQIETKEIILDSIKELKNDLNKFSKNFSK